MINRVPLYGNRFLGRHKRPMGLVCRTLLNPAPQNFFLFWRQSLVGFRRWHHFGRVLGQNPSNQMALFGVSRQKCLGIHSRLAIVQSHLRRPCRFGRPMTEKTVVRQNRPNITVEIDPLVSIGSDGQTKPQQAQNESCRYANARYRQLPPNRRIKKSACHQSDRIITCSWSCLPLF